MGLPRCLSVERPLLAHVPRDLRRFHPLSVIHPPRVVRRRLFARQPSREARSVPPAPPPPMPHMGGYATPLPSVGAGFPPPQPLQISPAPTVATGAANSVSSGAPSLAAFYAGQRFSVTKDRFIIGRGKQSSDLTIKDPNVSRQHAMVELLNGQYYMVDMGSTNGVEYNGQRIARKPIVEGDMFRICDHEVKFSYR